MAKIIERPEEGLMTPSQVQDGEIVEVVYIDTNRSAQGKILQRFGDIFLELGKGVGDSFSGLYKVNNGSVKLRVLPPGTQIEL